MTAPVDSTPLGDARGWLRERVDDGVKCPCCTQLAKVYRRKIHAAMAAALISAYRAAGTEWFHVPTVLGHGGDFAKLAYWGLIEEDLLVRDDGSTRAGWWQITAAGVDYVLGVGRVPKYARVYDGRCLSLTGEGVGIRDALGKKFRYDELMAGV